MVWTRKSAARAGAASCLLSIVFVASGGCSASETRESTGTAEAPLAGRGEWKFWGGDLHNTHFAAGETQITPANVGNLHVKWKYRTTGNVSAIPTVMDGKVYVPDWGWPLGLSVIPFGGGKVHAIDKDSGEALWTKSMSTYNWNRINVTSRSSPAIAGDLMIFGDFINITLPAVGLRHGSGATLYAVNRATGDLVWKTQLDAHPLAQVTQSPVIHDGHIYVGVSSQEESANKLGYTCCNFRGSMLSVDLATGRILWKTHTIPEGSGFTGGAVWGSSPAIDERRGVVYIATGNNYTVPTELDTCLARYAPDRRAQQENCLDRFDRADNYANAILALDLQSGAVRWGRKLINGGGWTFACEPRLVPFLPTETRDCPNPTSEDEDFGQAPMLLTTRINGARRDLVVAGQKTGVFWALDPDRSGQVVWGTVVGPGGTQGGMEFGGATDGTRIYAQITNDKHKEYTLVAGPNAGETVHGGLWAALDPATGTILWQVPDPASRLPMHGLYVHPAWGAGLGAGFWGMAMGPLTVANGVLFGGSLDREGHMYAFEAATGRILWSFASGGSVMSAPAVVDGVVYWGSGYQIGTNNNALFAFSL